MFQRKAPRVNTNSLMTYLSMLKIIQFFYILSIPVNYLIL